jgi:hypothetical protein
MVEHRFLSDLLGLRLKTPAGFPLFRYRLASTLGSDSAHAIRPHE